MAQVNDAGGSSSKPGGPSGRKPKPVKARAFSMGPAGGKTIGKAKTTYGKRVTKNGVTTQKVTVRQPRRIDY